MRNVLAHAGKNGRRVVSAFIATAFAQDAADAAKGQWRKVADHQLRPKLPKLAGFLDEAETDVLAYMTFPAAYRAKEMLRWVRRALGTFATHVERIIRRWTSAHPNARIEALSGLFQAARARARGYRNTATCITIIYLLGAPLPDILKSI